jgi:hypothetical protein
MGPFSTAASFSHVEIRSHIHLGFISSFYRYFGIARQVQHYLLDLNSVDEFLPTVHGRRAMR